MPNPTEQHQNTGSFEGVCCPCCDEREELLSACRSALSVLRDSSRNIDQVVTAELRRVISGKYSRPSTQARGTDA